LITGSRDRVRFCRQHRSILMALRFLLFRMHFLFRSSESPRIGCPGMDLGLPNKGVSSQTLSWIVLALGAQHFRHLSYIWSVYYANWGVFDIGESQTRPDRISNINRFRFCLSTMHMICKDATPPNDWARLNGAGVKVWIEKNSKSESSDVLSR
jgi:hypothetical protein